MQGRSHHQASARWGTHTATCRRACRAAATAGTAATPGAAPLPPPPLPAAAACPLQHIYKHWEFKYRRMDAWTLQVSRQGCDAQKPHACRACRALQAQAGLA